MVKDKTIIPDASAEALAGKLLEITPMWLHAMSAAFRNQGEVDVSTLTQMRTLHALQRGPCTFKELTSWRKVSAPTLSRTLEAMVKRGWVERIPHPDDKRQILLKLTAPGLAEFERIRVRMLQHTTHIMSALVSADRQHLFIGLNALMQHLQIDCPGDPINANSWSNDHKKGTPK